MDKKSQVLLWIFGMITLGSIVASFERYIILEDIEYTTDEATFQQSLLEE